MSRVIKFRGMVEGEMIYQDSVHSFNIRAAGDAECLHWLGFDLMGVATVDNLMQFTGLTDKNGVEVFEGDILEQYHFTDVNGKIHTILHRVVWSEKYAGWLCLNCKSNDENDGSCQFFVYAKTPFSVIGNIYQNPELLQTT